MKESNEKKALPASNPTSSLARNLLAQTLDHLSEIDNDKSAKRQANRLRRTIPKK